MVTLRLSTRQVCQRFSRSRRVLSGTISSVARQIRSSVSYWLQDGVAAESPEILQPAANRFEKFASAHLSAHLHPGSLEIFPGGRALRIGRAVFKRTASFDKSTPRRAPPRPALRKWDEMFRLTVHPCASTHVIGKNNRAVRCVHAVWISCVVCLYTELGVIVHRLLSYLINIR